MEASLFLLDGTRDDRRIPLPETIFLIGRDRQCHLRPHCELVSKLHCAIAAWSGKVRVRDLRSRNGTFINGRRVLGELVVADGDQLRVGSVVFEFHIKTTDGTPASAPLNPDDLRWLLEAPADEVVLSPGRRTRLRTDQPAGTHELSAGRHLHDYVAQHKRN